VSQRSVQSVIGRLITDGAFRQRFEERAGDCLAGLGKRGIDLNKIELAALLETDPRLWSRMAILIDRRLQRVNLGLSARSRVLTRRSPSASSMCSAASSRA